MSNENIIIDGSVTANDQFGANVVLNDGRRGFLPTQPSSNPEKGDSIKVIVTGESNDTLQLALAGTEQPVKIPGFEAGTIENEEYVLSGPATTAEGEVPEKLALMAIPDFGSAGWREQVLTFTNPTSDLIDASAQQRKRNFAALPSRLAAGWTGPSAGATTMDLSLFDVETLPTQDWSAFFADDLAKLRLDLLDPLSKPLVLGITNRAALLDEILRQRMSGLAVVETVNVPATSTKRKGKRKGKGKGKGNGNQGEVWRELRARSEGNRNLHLTLKRVEGRPGLIGFYEGIECYLPRSELAPGFKIDSVTSEGSQEWVKIVSVSRVRRSVVVSMRTRLSQEQLLQAGSEQKAKAAEQRKSRIAKRADEHAQAMVTYNGLAVGQEVEGKVLNVLKVKDKGGKESLLYFVKVGTQLTGGLRDQQVPFEKGTRVPRVLQVGEQISVRVVRKFFEVDKQTGENKPKVDLSMRPAPGPNGHHPTIGSRSDVKAGSPERVKDFHNAHYGRNNKPGKGNKGGHQTQSITSAGTALGDALKAALAARNEQE